MYRTAMRGERQGDRAVNSLRKLLFLPGKGLQFTWYKIVSPTGLQNFFHKLTEWTTKEFFDTNKKEKQESQKSHPK